MSKQQKIIVYTSTLCPVCVMLKDFLHSMNIEYNEINIDFRPIELAKLVAKTKRLSVPQMNMNGDWIFGFDPVRTLEVLQK